MMIRTCNGMKQVVPREAQDGESEYDAGRRVGLAKIYIAYASRRYSEEFCRGYEDGRWGTRKSGG